MGACISKKNKPVKSNTDRSKAQSVVTESQKLLTKVKSRELKENQNAVAKSTTGKHVVEVRNLNDSTEKASLISAEEDQNDIAKSETKKQTLEMRNQKISKEKENLVTDYSHLQEKVKVGAKEITTEVEETNKNDSAEKVTLGNCDSQLQEKVKRVAQEVSKQEERTSKLATMDMSKNSVVDCDTDAVKIDTVALDFDASTIKLEEISDREWMRVLESKFRKLDSNDNKRISREEFLSAWKKRPSVNAEDVFEEMDKKKDGVITLNEMKSWYKKRMVDAILSDFKKIDKNNDGTITEKDFLGACRSNFLCSDSDAEKLFKTLDVNGDRRLSFRTFMEGTEQYYIVRMLEETMNEGVVDDKKHPSNIKKFHLLYKNGSVILNNDSVMEAFNQIDWKQRDRRITIDEFITYFGNQGVTESLCKTLFKNFDTNGDGFITFEEFRVYFISQGKLPSYRDMLLRKAGGIGCSPVRK